MESNLGWVWNSDDREGVAHTICAHVPPNTFLLLAGSSLHAGDLTYPRTR